MDSLRRREQKIALQCLIYVDPVNYDMKSVFTEKRKDESVGSGRLCKRERCFSSHNS